MASWSIAQCSRETSRTDAAAGSLSRNNLEDDGHRRPRPLRTLANQLAPRQLADACGMHSQRSILLAVGRQCCQMSTLSIEKKVAATAPQNEVRLTQMSPVCILFVVFLCWLSSNVPYWNDYCLVENCESPK